MKLTEQRFLEDVKNHRMVVMRDDGVNRHIRFKEPETMMEHFDLITWPGYLLYTGDMGSFLFRRTTDMFSFFRTDRRDFNFNNAGSLSINPSYWAEKLESVDKNGGFEEFDEEEFKQIVSSYRLQWVRHSGLDKDERRELWEAVESDVLGSVEEGEHVAKHAAYEFCHRVGKRTFQFDDFFEHRLTKFTYRFMWCCYALAWGVQKYDTEASLEKVAA